MTLVDSFDAASQAELDRIRGSRIENTPALIPLRSPYARGRQPLIWRLWRTRDPSAATLTTGWVPQGRQADSPPNGEHQALHFWRCDKCTRKTCMWLRTEVPARTHYPVCAWCGYVSPDSEVSRIIATHRLLRHMMGNTGTPISDAHLVMLDDFLGKITRESNE